MYLAKYVGGWTITIIGRFYNGRDHSTLDTTVCYGIRRIEALRESDADALETALRLINPAGTGHLICSAKPGL